MNKIALILVTYNGEKFLPRCLESITNSSSETFVFAYDNLSNDNSVEILEQNTLHFLKKGKKNLGFGQANNYLLQEAIRQGFEYFFLINQDVYLEENTLSLLQNTMLQNPEIGILSPLHYNTNGSLDHNFEHYLSTSSTKKKYLQSVEFVNAAAWLLTKKCIEKVGFFHPLFFHYGEDRNFCDRCIYHSIDIAITAQTSIIHDRTKSSKSSIIKSSYQKLITILVNPNISLPKAIATSLVNIFGMCKYYSKELNTKESLHLLKIYISKWLNCAFNKNLISLRKEMKSSYRP